MKRIAFVLILVLFSSCRVNRVKPGLSEVVHISENNYSCSFDGVVHNFILCLPQNCENYPLVVMLPGYNNTAEAMQNQTGFDKQACKRGYAVVYVTGSVQKGETQGGIGWNSGISTAQNQDVSFLTALVRYLQTEYPIDKKRVFAAGFSNGGFMIHRLAMEAGNTFSACVSVAGKMPEKIWKERNRKNKVGFFQITGEKDAVIPKLSDGSARHARDPAIEEVMDYWANSNGLSSIEIAEIGEGSTITKWSKRGKNGLRENQVWHLFVKDGNHSWPSFAVNGIDANSLILDFFDSF